MHYNTAASKARKSTQYPVLVRLASNSWDVVEFPNRDLADLLEDTAQTQARELNESLAVHAWASRIPGLDSLIAAL